MSPKLVELLAEHITQQLHVSLVSLDVHGKLRCNTLNFSLASCRTGAQTQKTMELDEMYSVPMYVLVAPDGTPQTSTLGQDLPESFAITKLLAKAGKGQTPESLIRQGFRFMPVKVSIIQNGPVNENVNLALAKPKGIKPTA